LTAALAALPLAAAPADELVAYQISNGTSIDKSLTGKPGDPAEGRAVAINRRLGNCLACHSLPVPEEPFHGVIAPDLSGVASRYSEGEIRLRIVNAKVLNEAAFMPAYYRNDGFTRVAKDFEGKPILSAEQVEDVVAYLMTLKGN
jgi:sulfur-oxidizing protein SoxX